MRNEITMKPMAMSGLYILNALLRWSWLRRNSSENSTTPSSQAYSTSRSLAMITKFWLVVARITPSIMAKVNVVEAIMKQAGFFRYSFCLMRRGSRYFITTMFSSEAIMP